MALLIAGCGGEPPAVDKSVAADKGVIDKTGSSSSGAVDKTGVSAAPKAAGARKLPGSVCALLTPAEIEAVVKLGSPAAGIEANEPGIERSCTYGPLGVAAVALTLQGELEPLDAGGLRGLPGAKRSQLRNAEAVYWPTTAVLYVIKGQLAVTVQVVIPPAGETAESAELKLAQSIADRLP